MIYRCFLFRIKLQNGQINNIANCKKSQTFYSRIATLRPRGYAMLQKTRENWEISLRVSHYCFNRLVIKTHQRLACEQCTVSAPIEIGTKNGEKR